MPEPQKVTLRQVAGEISAEEARQLAHFGSEEEMFSHLAIPGNQVVLRDPKDPTRYAIFEASFVSFVPEAPDRSK